MGCRKIEGAVADLPPRSSAWKPVASGSRTAYFVDPSRLERVSVTQVRVWVRAETSPPLSPGEAPQSMNQYLIDCKNRLSTLTADTTFDAVGNRLPQLMRVAKPEATPIQPESAFEKMSLAVCRSLKP